MARIARVVIPGVPHHVIQRGNLRQDVFFGDEDYQAYLELMAQGCRKAGVEVLAYCLMPAQVHLMIVPPEKDSLRAAVADVNRRYARRINARRDQTGHLWQDRYGSYPMDEASMAQVGRYIERLPVGAGLAATPGDYRWSSAAAHLAGQGGDGLVRAAAAWVGQLDSPVEAAMLRKIILHETTGRPLGSATFLQDLEARTGRKLVPAKRGPKQKVPRDTGTV